MVEIWSGVSKSLTHVATGGKISALKYRVTEELIYVESGVLSSKGEQYPMWAVRDIDFMQSLIQKTRKVSTLRVRFEMNDYTGKPEILLEDIEAGRELVPLILEAAKKARLEHKRLEQTQHINYQGAIPTQANAESKTDDLMTQLEKLGGLLEKGILSKEEFEDQKRKLLGNS
jgi:uncharacterized membrane protein YdbT with pleckstrin-like domain